MSEVEYNQKKKIKPLTNMEIYQLWRYCLWAEDEGSFFGSEKHFRKRHENIKLWLEDCIEKLGD
jgi:hypothetical protein